MDNVESLTHTLWECKYHVVWIPKYRKKVMFQKIREQLGTLFRDLALQKGCKILEGHLLQDHVHMLISIPPKFAVSQIVGFIKGKSAIHIARVYVGRRKNFTGEHFWARGFFVSTVGANEAAIREYIKNQEREDQRLDQLTLLE
jgi:putative transposase